MMDVRFIDDLKQSWDKLIQDALNFVGSCALGLLLCFVWLSADSWGAM